MPINPLLPKQLIMIAALKHLALPKDIDDIRLLDGSQPMRNSNGRPALGDTLKRLLDEFLARC